MSEEIQTQEQPKNTVALVWMICSIIGLLLLFTVFGTVFWIFLLFIWFILGIIGLFYRPRGKARVAICIPLIVLIVIASLMCYIWSSVKTPTSEFINWAQAQIEQFDEEKFDGDRFGDIVENEINNKMNSLSEDDWNNLYEASTWSNVLEKGSYLLFSILQEAFEKSVEIYNSEEIIDENINEADDTEIIEVDEDENIDEEVQEPEAKEISKENIEVFSDSEKNEIEQIINILE